MAEDQKITVDRLCHVPKHGQEGTEIVVCQRDDGVLLVVEGQTGADQARTIREISVEDALRTAEHALAGNPKAVTWPPAITVLAAAYLASVAYAQRRMASEAAANEGGENAQ